TEYRLMSRADGRAGGRECGERDLWPASLGPTQDLGDKQAQAGHYELAVGLGHGRTNQAPVGVRAGPVRGKNRWLAVGAAHVVASAPAPACRARIAARSAGVVGRHRAAAGSSPATTVTRRPMRIW